MILEALAVLSAIFTKNIYALRYSRSYGYYSYYNYGYYNYGYYNYGNFYYGYSSIGAIVGGVIGTLVCIAVLITLICCCLKSKGRTGRVIVPTNTPTVTYISSNQQSATVAPPPYNYANPAYPPQAQPMPQSPYAPDQQVYPTKPNAHPPPPPPYQPMSAPMPQPPQPPQPSSSVYPPQ